MKPRPEFEDESPIPFPTTTREKMELVTEVHTSVYMYVCV